MNNLLAELAAVSRIGQSLVIGGLAQAHALCGNAQAGAVHQGHDIFDEAQLAVAAEFGMSVLVHQLAGGRAVNAQLVLNAAHAHAALALVINKHGEAAAVTCALFRTGQHEVDVSIAIGDKALHAVQQPAAVGLAVRALSMTLCRSLPASGSVRSIDMVSPAHTRGM